MCGIVSVLNFDESPVSTGFLTEMTRALAHRGPDGEGVWINKYVGLGHRRLAILDLSPNAQQPMLAAEGRYALTYNGEIYNHVELRRELESFGYKFQSRSDTEVVLRAFEHWGEKCIKRFNGMFALAIWDSKTQELFLARDRYGIKPLYYFIDDNCFIAASEIKALLEHPSLKAEIDRRGLVEYLTFQNFFTDRTLFKNVRMFPAGNYWKVPLDPKRTTKVQYWDFDFQENTQSSLSENDALEELDSLFRKAVQRQLRSDVDIGAYLSGGTDSGSITAVAAKSIPYLKTFTCGFDLHSASGLELAFDEREKAELMSYIFKTEHYEMVLKAGDMERILNRLVWHLEEPRVGQSYPNFYVAQLASKFVKVVLSGAGGDELFGGYPWRYYRAVVNDDFSHYLTKYYGFWQRLVPDSEFSALLSPIWNEVSDVNTRAIFSDVFPKDNHETMTPEAYVNHSLYLEAKTFLHGLLVVEDKVSMAHSVETRVPFLDNDLVDFAVRLPVRFKLGNLSEVVRLNENEPGPKTKKYFERTKDGKLILQKLMKRHIPEKVMQCEKLGFSAPDASWFKGESIDFVRGKILSKQAKIYEFLDYRTTEKLVNDHLENRVNRRLLIWSLLNLEIWCETFV